MGCCCSTPSAEPDDTAPSRQLPRSVSSNDERSSEPRPNQRIRAPSPLLKSPKDVSTRQPPWTRSHLQRQREIFFETRVGGQEEVWGAVRLVCECLRREDTQEAQSILDAANLTVPTGRVARGRAARARGVDGHRLRGGIFDETGRLYEVPDWVITDPQDIIEDVDSGRGAEKDVDGGTSDTDEVASHTTYPSRPEKGKGRAEDVGEQITLRVRLSDQSPDMMVSLGSKQPVATVLESIRQQTGAVRAKVVYMGKPLDENRTLADQGWTAGQTVQAFVLNRGDDSLA